MTHAYSEWYLEDAMKNLGEAFEYAALVCNLSLDKFMNMFVESGYAAAFADGHPKFLAGLSGTELVWEVYWKLGIKHDFLPALAGYDYSPEYWCGWVLAYYQWTTGLSFETIHSRITMQDVLRMYYPLHEASEDKFVDVLNKRIITK